MLNPFFHTVAGHTNLYELFGLTAMVHKLLPFLFFSYIHHSSDVYRLLLIGWIKWLFHTPLLSCMLTH